MVVQTSCKNGAPLQSDKQGNEKRYVMDYQSMGSTPIPILTWPSPLTLRYFCKDDKDDDNQETKPLAKIVTSTDEYYVFTLLFTKDNWNKPQAVKM